MPIITIANYSLPVSEYRAEFVGIETTTHFEYGDGLKWTFVIAEGPQKGRECYRTTKCEPTPRNSCGKFLAALASVEASDGLQIDPDDFVGQIYNVIVEEAQSGLSTRVESFTAEVESYD